MTAASQDQARANATACALAVDEWIRAGVTHAVVAPGSRSTPMAIALAARDEISVQVHHDERAAAFISLGLGLSSGRPAVLLCTSGTAAAELHPAVVEADLAGVPLLVVTADRPPELQDVGAAQTIDQVHLYGRAVRWFHAPGPPDAATVGTWRSMASRAAAEALGGPRLPGPVHLNLAFREPLVGVAEELPSGRADGSTWHRSIPSTRLVEDRDLSEVRSLVDSADGVIIAGFGCGNPMAVEALAAALGWPVLADARSGLGPPSSAVRHGDLILRDADFAARHRPEAVLRLGAQPASKVINAWVADAGAPEIVVTEGLHWPDPGRAATVVIRASVDPLIEALTALVTRRVDHRSLDAWQRAEAAASAAVDAALATGPIGEPLIARRLAAAAGPQDTIVVSSSMPFRDLEWCGGPIEARVLANRGANGIDGVVSTAVGVALDRERTGQGGSTFVLVGDVAFLHDSNALLGLTRRNLDLTVVVVDNDGGGIFSHLPQADALPTDRFEELFGTPHGVDISALGAAHGIEVIEPVDRSELEVALASDRDSGRSRIIRIRTDRNEAVRLYERVRAAVITALADSKP